MKKKEFFSFSLPPPQRHKGALKKKMHQQPQKKTFFFVAVGGIMFFNATLACVTNDAGTADHERVSFFKSCSRLTRGPGPSFCSRGVWVVLCFKLVLFCEYCFAKMLKNQAVLIAKKIVLLEIES